MALRYFIKYFDVIGIEHRLNISDDNFSGDATQVDGRVTLTYSETDDPLEAIRGQGLSVELEANQDLTFNDLWSEEEKSFPVEYKRDDVTLFQGWLNPEGFFEDYVSTNWKVTFDCVDGLGYLKDLSFVEDTTGFPFSGRMSYIELLAKALVRTGIYQNINVDIQIRYTGLSESENILENVFANTDRYIKDDGETIMSCDEVIRDILEPFGAVLTSFSGAWYVYKPNQLYLNQTAVFDRYTYSGVPTGPPFTPPTITLDTSQLIGSNSEGITPHHCSGNQSITNKSSIGAYRISYKYGLTETLNNNASLVSDDGVTIPFWDVLSTTNLIIPFPIGEGGVTFDAVADAVDIEQNLRSEFVLVEDSIKLTIDLKWEIDDYVGGGNYYAYRLLMCDKEITEPGVTTFSLDENGAWSSVVWTLSDPITSSNDIISISTPVKPATITGDGYFYVVIMTPKDDSGNDYLPKLVSARVIPSRDTSGSTVEGEFHTFQRTSKPSAKIKDIKEVATGDTYTDLYEGTLYKADAVTPTETWNRKDFVESKPILQIMGEETMRMSQLPARVFSGDVYGFFNYLSVVDIDGFDSLFMPVKYSYDTKSNVINAEFRQMYGNELVDIDYKKTIDYGNTVKPTIKG